LFAHTASHLPSPRFCFHVLDAQHPLQVEIDARVRRQREIDAERARHELLREEEKTKAAADAKQEGRRRQQQQQQQPQQQGGSANGTGDNNGAATADAAPTTGSSKGGPEEERAGGGASPPSATPASAVVKGATKSANPSPPVTKDAARVDTTREAAPKAAQPAPSDTASALSGAGNDAAVTTRANVTAGDSSWGAWEEEKPAEDEVWEVTTTKKKDKSKPMKPQQQHTTQQQQQQQLLQQLPNGTARHLKGMKPGDALAAAAVGGNRDGGPTTRLVTPEGQLITYRGIVCRQFLRGQCDDRKCNKQHPRSHASCTVACDYFLSGKCSRGNQCRYAHVSTEVLAQFLAALKAADAAEAAAAAGAGAGAAPAEPPQAKHDSTPPSSEHAQATSSAQLQPPTVSSAVVAGGDEAVRSAEAAAGGGIPVLAAVHFLLSTPQLVGVLDGIATATHAHAAGGCLVCSLRDVDAARRSGSGGGGGEGGASESESADKGARHPLAVSVQAVAVALKRAMAPSAHPSSDAPWSVGSTVAFALDVLRCTVCPAAVRSSADEGDTSNATAATTAADGDACDGTAVGRAFGVLTGAADASSEWSWSFALDVDLSLNAAAAAAAASSGQVPRLAAVLPEVTLVRVSGWAMDCGAWLRGAVSRELSESALLSALGLSLPAGAHAGSPPPRVSLVVLERNEGSATAATAVVLLPTPRGAGTAAVWADGVVTELSCNDGWILLESLIAGTDGGPSWGVTALLLSRS
jgi:hypothetical protein